MDELEFDFSQALAWFSNSQSQPFELIHCKAEHVATWPAQLAIPLRRCYITDASLIDRAAATNLPQADVLATKLPDPGSTMAGDFGEIICYFFQSARELPQFAIGAKKWRLKQDRTKPAPRSDVIHFLMPSRPVASESDALLCSEVKLKSTAGTSTPIASAIADCSLDRTSRLADSLVWLRERAVGESLGDVDIPLLERFINAIDHPPAARRFRAVAVICESLLARELQSAPTATNPEYDVVVIAVPNLKETYEAVFAAARTGLQVQV